jgi:hypothetical protein
MQTLKHTSNELISMPQEKLPRAVAQLHAVRIGHIAGSGTGTEAAVL